ncbi:Syntaxin-1A isoform X2 [Aphelenchoides bicaudatus]|nr:Syntaxin-1A isoform X2 [Aphelenchoides bicaudatus]
MPFVKILCFLSIINQQHGKRQKKAAVKPSSSSRSRTSTEDTITIRLDNGQPAANDHLLEENMWEEMDSFLKNVELVRERIKQAHALVQKISEIHKTIRNFAGHFRLYCRTQQLCLNVQRTFSIHFKIHPRCLPIELCLGLNNEIKRIGNATDAVSRIKKDQARTITRTFQTVLTDFNAEQVKYKEDCEKTIARYMEIGRDLLIITVNKLVNSAGLQMDQDEMDKAIDTGKLFDTSSIMLADRDKKQLYESAKSRHEDILKLEASIRELHEIFQDMAMLIESQGEIVDRIETNVSYASDYAQRALTNVNQAKRAKNRNIKLKIAIAICLVVTIIILFFVVSSLFCLYLPFMLETLKSRLFYQNKKSRIFKSEILDIVRRMIKDRLAEFQKKAGIKSPKSASTKNTDNADSDWTEMDSFLKNVEVVREKIKHANSLVQKIREIHRAIQSLPNVAPEYVAELNNAVVMFKENSQVVAKSIQDINKEIKSIGDSNDVASRIKKDQASTITRTFQKVLIDFNAEQVNYKEQCEKKITTYLGIAGLQMDQDEVDKAIETGDLFNTTSFMLAGRDKKQLFEDVRSRHEDIIKLEASIRELHEIFQDMSMLVEVQASSTHLIGEVADRIETNVEHAAEYATRARTNVSQAKRSRNRNIKLKIAAAVCLVITIIILFFIISSLFCVYLPSMLRQVIFGSVRCLSTKQTVEKSAIETLRSRLYYQSKKRGILENDILLGGFVDSELNKLTETELHEYDKIINGDHMEWDLYYFLIGKKTLPPELNSNPVFTKMSNFVKKIKKQ